MARPLKQGEAAISHDVDALNRVVRRVLADSKRSQKEKDEIVGHLNQALILLMTGKRTSPPPSKRTRAEV